MTKRNTILNITSKVHHIPLKTPFITALRRVETIEFVRVHVECLDGREAIGEAPATFAITGEDIPIILASIAEVREELIGLDARSALEKLHTFSIGSSAKAALDMAFMSLLGFFKIENSEPIKTDITISLNEKEKMLHDARVAFADGMDILKVKLGSDINHAIEVTKLLCKELPQAELLIDANQAWSVADSLAYVEALGCTALAVPFGDTGEAQSGECHGLAFLEATHPVVLIEQPVIAEDLLGLKEITNATSLPILADEATFTLEDVKKVVESKSADMINIKLMKCGGVSKAVEILEYAREKNITCMLGSMLEGPYSINAALYLAFNYSDVIKYVDLDSPLLYKEASDALDFSYEGAKIIYKS